MQQGMGRGARLGVAELVESGIEIFDSCGGASVTYEVEHDSALAVAVAVAVTVTVTVTLVAAVAVAVAVTVAVSVMRAARGRWMLAMVPGCIEAQIELCNEG